MKVEEGSTVPAEDLPQRGGWGLPFLAIPGDCHSWGRERRVDKLDTFAKPLVESCILALGIVTEMCCSPSECEATRWA